MGTVPAADTVLGMRTLSGDVATYMRGELSRRKIKPAQFADQIGLSTSSVARWLNEEVAFKLDVLEAFAVGLGMTPAELIDAAEREAAMRAAENLPGATEAEKEDLRRAIDRARPRQNFKMDRASNTGT